MKTDKMMKTRIKIIIIAFLITGISPVLQAQTNDEEGCTDYPFMPRLGEHRINRCFVKEADTIGFPVGRSMEEASKKQVVTGNSFVYYYTLKDSAKKVFPLVIFRNFEDTLRKNRGYVVARVVDPGYLDSFITGKIEKENLTAWITIRVFGSDYLLTIVEKHRKVKIIPADDLWYIIDKKDSVTVDVFFKDDTSTIIPASYPVIDQIYEMMTRHPLLKIYIQAHTDDAQGPRNNKILAAERAKVVLDALVAKGIEKKRMKSCGWGFDKPIGDNRTEEGRTMNRRLVLVRIE